MTTRYIQRRILTLMALLAAVTLGAGANTSQKTLVPQTSGVDAPEAHLGKAYDSLKQDRYDEAAGEFRAAPETGYDAHLAGALSLSCRTVRDEEIRRSTPRA